MNNKDLSQRKHPRLKEYDYSQPGAYFITICTKDRKHLLGNITVGRGALTPPCIRLSDPGKTAEKHILNIDSAYEGIIVERYIIMPNHIHLLIRIESSGGMKASRPTIQTIVRSFKTMVTRDIGFSIWQTSFHEHIVRNENDFLAIWKYIDENPLKWQQDKYYSP